MKLEINVCPYCLKRAELNNYFFLPKSKRFATICDKCVENPDFENISEEIENIIINNSKTISEKILSIVDKLFTE